jgi:hypothetical protein
MSDPQKPKRDESSSKDYSFDKAFLGSEVLPDIAATFGSQIRSIEDAIKDGDIVLDTNVLLLPYGAGANSLTQIVGVYKTLNKEGRLFIPAQVAREFIKNRPIKIADLYQGIADRLSRFAAPEALSYPILEGIDEFRALNVAVKKAADLKGEIGKANTALLKKIRSWEWNDPVSQAYKAEFPAKLIVEPTCDKQVTLDELRRRYELSIPPGYKDAAKEDSGIGDFLIWKTILLIGSKNKKDLIFVSGDEKSDWQHRAGGAGFLPRYELLDEFRRSSSGKALYIIPLSKLLELLKVEGESVKEIKQEERRILDANTVTVVCPHCDALVEWRLAEYFGSSAKPYCPMCNSMFHVHRTRSGVTVHKPNERVAQSREPGESTLEQVSCPQCKQGCEANLGINVNSTAWARCEKCSLSFPVHRRADGTVLVSRIVG